MRIQFLPMLLLATFGLQAAEPLFDAIRRDDTAAVKRLLDGGTSADSRDADGVPALMAATLFAGADCVAALLDRGANPNAATEDGATALMWAIPDLEKARLLLSHKADVNAKSSNLSRTPLLIAAGYPGTVELLRLLLDKGADLRARDKNGDLALGRAREADVDVARFLVERGVGVNEPNAGGATALSRAISRPYMPTIEFLLAKGGKIGKNSLTSATHWQDPTLIEKLLDMGADVNARTSNFGRTPLINAASSELAGAATLKLLLEKGADPNVADNDGERALDWAMHRCDQAKIDVLKQFGARDAETPRDKTWPQPDGIADPRLSVARSLALLMPTMPVPFQERGCITCHNQTLPAQLASAAREIGIPVNEDLAKKNIKQIRAVWKPIGEASMQGALGPGGDLTVGYIAMALASEKYPLDHMTAALAHAAASRQMPDGSWIESTSRPPMEYSTITRTAMALRTIALYPIEGRKQQTEERLSRARAWLLQAKPQSAEGYAMRLMALAWTKASRNQLDTVAREWIAHQRADGGRSQLSHLGTDAYATGINLYAPVRSRHPGDERGLSKRRPVPAQEPISGRKLV